VERKFEATPYKSYDKWIEVYGPEELSIRIDHDDVDPDTVEEATRKLISILNKYWDFSDAR